MTLLTETLSIMDLHNLKSKDVIFIGSLSGYACTWSQFLVLADVEYNNGFGCQEVAQDLIIIFNNDAVMSRMEYDGSEWWKYTPRPKILDTLYTITKLVDLTGYMNSLAEMNRGK